jgi:hypothetical protein
MPYTITRICMYAVLVETISVISHKIGRDGSIFR